MLQAEADNLFLGLLRKLRGLEQTGVMPRTMRIPSKTELDSAPRMPKRIQFYCIHDKHRWSICRNCGRTAKQGEQARIEYMTELAELARAKR